MNGNSKTGNVSPDFVERIRGTQPSRVPSIAIGEDSNLAKR